jgi:Na+-translocating ferredoxin:NAD+ oxidoreductase RnfA subunit
MTGGVTLFVSAGSSVVEFTVAVFVITPATGAFTNTVAFVVALTASVPNDQLTVPTTLVVPLPLALTNETFAGNTSLATTLLATDGPEFVTLKV